jgi:hypothetical protein
LNENDKPAGLFSLSLIFFQFITRFFQFSFFLNLKFSKNLNQTNLLSMNQQNQTGPVWPVFNNIVILAPCSNNKNALSCNEYIICLDHRKKILLQVKHTSTYTNRITKKNFTCTRHHMGIRSATARSPLSTVTLQLERYKIVFRKKKSVTK